MKVVGPVAAHSSRNNLASGAMVAAATRPKAIAPCPTANPIRPNKTLYLLPRWGRHRNAPSSAKERGQRVPNTPHQSLETLPTTKGVGRHGRRRRRRGVLPPLHSDHRSHPTCPSDRSQTPLAPTSPRHTLRDVERVWWLNPPPRRPTPGRRGSFTG